MKRRLPAEWEEQDGVLLAWPHEKTEWRPHLEAVQSVFVHLLREIIRFETALVVAPSADEVFQKARITGDDRERVIIYEMETNDTWTRDFGPITVYENNRPLILDFGFNGWGLKYPSNLDNQVSRRLHALGAFKGAPIETVGLILEGGSIESDGDGTILATSRCLLSPNRNPHLDRSAIEAALGELLGTDRFLWLENGSLRGDDTDSHIDTLARLCPHDVILHTACDDPEDEHRHSISAMIEELKSFRSKRGKPYRLIELPWPDPQFGPSGERLPATYANFLIINGAVLVPTYRSEKDSAAMEAIGAAFSDREIIGVDCLPLLYGYGSLHCISMQLPRGALTGWRSP